MRQFLGKLRRSLGAYWRAAGWAARPAVLLVAALVLAAGIWLVTSRGADRFTPLPEALLDGRNLSEVQSVLESAGIPVRPQGGRLLVPKESLRPARRLLGANASAAKDPAATLQQLSNQDDIWRTQTQNEKRWQAAKMAALGRLIAEFPTVESAAVIFEPGSPRTFGAPAERPTAAVKVRLKEGSRVSPSLATAIGDLVAGSVLGMSSQDVRIVDGSGQSYRAAEPNSSAGAEWERRRTMETYYASKVREAMPYIQDLVVSVTAIPAGSNGAKLAGALGVPRSYLAEVANALGEAASAPEAGTVATAELSRIQQTAAKVLDVTPAEVRVDCYVDAGCLRKPGAAASTPAGPATGHLTAAAAAGFGAATFVGGLVIAAARLRARRRAGASSPHGGVGEAGDWFRAGGTDGKETPDVHSDGLAMLGELSAEDILPAVRDEHPQTVATVLAHLDPAKAAAVLAKLDGPGRAEVSRRLTRMQQADPALVSEIAHQLAARSRAGRSGQTGAIDGEDKMAAILRHADPETEKAVLQALAGQAPGLAESVRKRMLIFEDITELPPGRLGAALEGVASEDIAVALRAAAEETKGKILSALSSDASRRLREEMERIGPVRLSEVEAAQQRVAQAVRDADAGRYVSAEAQERRQLLA